ncbi:Uncharacterised protein family (UPF0175) [Cruoricaptor ignavus]|uniref:Uncharacterized protein family (UPF0175) n=1 Tax=Cruoricaptor ignavus TaxID=1118202 RepID=A0A1M6DT99_9FLAO|nr:UPF0175 family protein [Cruoricaptor ignavus]SHI76405.1 Uncharacterised protein family (UPF0175) [Cruoricaptor ignavus]
MNYILVQYPDFLADAMRISSEDFAKEARLATLLKLFEQGKISSGNAAKAIGVSRLEFLELAGTENVETLFSEALSEDLANA